MLWVEKISFDFPNIFPAFLLVTLGGDLANSSEQRNDLYLVTLVVTCSLSRVTSHTWQHNSVTTYPAWVCTSPRACSSARPTRRCPPGPGSWWGRWTWRCDGHKTGEILSTSWWEPVGIPHHLADLTIVKSVKRICRTVMAGIGRGWSHLACIRNKL